MQTLISYKRVIGNIERRFIKITVKVYYRFSIIKMRLATNAYRKDTFYQIFQRTIKMKIVTTIQTNTITETDSKQEIYNSIITKMKTVTSIITTIKVTMVVMERTIFIYQHFNF